MVASHYVSSDVKVVRNIASVFVKDKAGVVKSPIRRGSVGRKWRSVFQSRNDRLDIVVVV